MYVCVHSISPPPFDHSGLRFKEMEELLETMEFHFILRARDESLDVTVSTFSCYNHSGTAPGCFLGTWGGAGVN